MVPGSVAKKDLDSYLREIQAALNYTMRLFLTNNLISDLTVIEDGNDQNHEGCEVKLPYQCNEHEAKLLKLNIIRTHEFKIRSLTIDIGI